MTAENPFELFDRWLADARAAGAVLPQAMALATADADGMPDARMVMLRRTGRDGFVFFTDRDSAKGASFAPIRAPCCWATGGSWDVRCASAVRSK